jgi:DNA polymerase-3 subunit epsilon
VSGDVPLAESLPPRPEFYDFDLFARQPDAAVTEIPLQRLRCVVFDTETTGLEPSKGDELIAIGAVRVVNGRVVSGETFDQLIDPGREIPASSTRFHGLTAADVTGKPGADAALSRFHAFVGRAVLVAYNAAFDMKFLELKQEQAGVAFENPVLDILLLSAFLHDHTGDHTLEAIARRFAVEVSGRHTALGDAMTAARIFAAMLEPLNRRGIVTLGDALEVSGRMASLRRKQVRF